MAEALIAGSGSDGEFHTAEGCHIRELLNDARVPQTSLATARVEAGVTTALHRVSVQEWYVIVAGSGVMTVGGEEPFPVGPGDTVAIPAGVAQCIRNTGGTDLVFHCICQPRFRPECYEALGTPLVTAS